MIYDPPDINHIKKLSDELSLLNKEIESFDKLCDTEKVAIYFHAHVCKKKHDGIDCYCMWYHEKSWDDNLHRLYLNKARMLLQLQSGVDYPTALRMIAAI